MPPVSKVPTPNTQPTDHIHIIGISAGSSCRDQIASIVSSPSIAFPPITRSNTALSPITWCNTARRNTNNIAHAILIPLVAILHTLARAFEPVVPSGDARKKPKHPLKRFLSTRQSVRIYMRSGERSPIVWRTVVLFGNELVVAFDGEVEGGDGDADGSQEEDGPAGGAERPREVKVPALPEAVVVVEEECLEELVLRIALLLRYGPCSTQGQRTTMAMPAHWTMALKESTPTATCQPAALRCTPPEMMTMKDTMAHSSTTTPKDVRKPTVLHILQKDGSFVQSLILGKGTQVPVTAEQRLCRPYEYSRSPLGL